MAPSPKKPSKAKKSGPKKFKAKRRTYKDIIAIKQYVKDVGDGQGIRFDHDRRPNGRKREMKSTEGYQLADNKYLGIGHRHEDGNFRWSIRCWMMPPSVSWLITA